MNRGLTLFLAVALLGAGGACRKKEAAGPAALDLIAASPPNVAARALRDEVSRLVGAGKVDDAAKRLEGMAKLVGEILAAMDGLSHQKSAVPDFGVVRYVEALRDLGENLRGFDRIYSPNNPASLKRDMLQGMLDQLKLKLR